jgi:hypothetical protein
MDLFGEKYLRLPVNRKLIILYFPFPLEETTHIYFFEASSGLNSNNQSLDESTISNQIYIRNEGFNKNGKRTNSFLDAIINNS